MEDLINDNAKKSIILSITIKNIIGMHDYSGNNFK